MLYPTSLHAPPAKQITTYQLQRSNALTEQSNHQHSGAEVALSSTPQCHMHNSTQWTSSEARGCRLH